MRGVNYNAKMLSQASAYFQSLQSRLVSALESADGGRFVSEEWTGKLGRGLGATIENSAVFERCGVNFSRVSAAQLPKAATARHPELAGCEFSAAGVSLVAHPRNPKCPTAHMNARFFQAGNSWWFGGGMDLTPHYGYDEDCVHFHRACKAALDPFGGEYYPRFKAACDEYFWIPHRGEARGVGGIFYDDFCERDFAFSFALARAAADAFIPAYVPIARRRCGESFGAREREHQLWRRGRYVEFNLVCDRGTLFGLQSGGRAESILMSLPPLASWRNNWSPPVDGEEAEFSEKYLRPRDWLGLEKR